jgi:hypothetical protein
MDNTGKNQNNKQLKINQLIFFFKKMGRQDMDKVFLLTKIHQKFIQIDRMIQSQFFYF